jgi:hypothetical protein
MMRDSLVEQLERAARVTDPNPDDDDEEAEPAEDERDIDDDDDDEEEEVPDEPESEPAKRPPKPKRAGKPKAGPGPAAGDLGPNPDIPAPAGILPAAGDPAGNPGHLSSITAGNPCASFQVVSSYEDSIIFQYVAEAAGEKARFSAVIPFELPGRYLLTLLRARMPDDPGPARQREPTS